MANFIDLKSFDHKCIKSINIDQIVSFHPEIDKNGVCVHFVNGNVEIFDISYDEFKSLLNEYFIKRNDIMKHRENESNKSIDPLSHICRNCIYFNKDDARVLLSNPPIYVYKCLKYNTYHEYNSCCSNYNFSINNLNNYNNKAEIRKE